jgi:type II secretory pathway pseudopilin PulG
VRRPRDRSLGTCAQTGFTYLALLYAVTIIGITLATVGVVWSTQIRREKEADLLFAGDQIRAAIGRYYGDIPTGVHNYPATLADLLQDQRSPLVHRHLRRLYYDPMSASIDWQLIEAPEGGIMGVASKSVGKPIKQDNFPNGDANFKEADCYCNWQFIYVPLHGRQTRTRLQP